MDELLKKLLAAEVLTEDTKVELEAAIKKQLDEAMVSARQQATVEVTAQLEEQWIQEREVLIEALDAKVSEVLTDELSELKNDIDRFRDLEAEHAEKLVEAKTEMAESLKGDIETLIEKLDKFLEIRLTAELEELRENVEVIRKNEFGKKVFEAFVTEFKKHYTTDGSQTARLHETEQRLEDTLATLEETERKMAKIQRNQKLEKVLTPLSGRTREVMEAILKNVDTNMLEEAYKTYVGRVLKETVDTDGKTSEKENKVLAEGVKKTTNGIIRNGNSAGRLNEDTQLDQESRGVISDDEKARMRRIAGIAN